MLSSESFTVEKSILYWNLVLHQTQTTNLPPSTTPQENSQRSFSSEEGQHRLYRLVSSYQTCLIALFFNYHNIYFFTQCVCVCVCVLFYSLTIQCFFTQCVIVCVFIIQPYLLLFFFLLNVCMCVIIQPYHLLFFYSMCVYYITRGQYASRNRLG